MPADPATIRAVRLLALVAGLLLLSLFFCQSRYLARWDSAQFALALDHLDVRVHQPHPPGYPAYLAVGHILRTLLLGEVNKAFLIQNWLLTAGAAWAAFLLGRRWAGPLAGAVCAVLILASPLTRYYASVALTYPAGLCWFAWLGYSAWEVLREKDRRWWWPWLIIGIGGAFRLPTLVLGAPLLALVWWKSNAKAKILGPLIMVLILGAAYAPVMAASGGFAGWREAIASEGIKHEVRFGNWGDQPFKELRENWGAFTDYFWQGFLLPIPVVLGLLMGWFVKPKKSLPDEKSDPEESATPAPSARIIPLDFLLWWTLPGFLFYLAVHSNFAGIFLDYSVPVALVLACGGKRLSRGLPIPQTGLALTLAVLCVVRFEVSDGLTDLGHPLIRLVDQLMEIHIQDIPQASPSASTLLLVGESFKQDAYYLPGYRVMWTKYLLSSHGDTILTMQGHQLTPLTIPWHFCIGTNIDCVSGRRGRLPEDIQWIICDADAFAALDPNIAQRAEPISPRSEGLLWRIPVQGERDLWVREDYGDGERAFYWYLHALSGWTNDALLFSD